MCGSLNHQPSRGLGYAKPGGDDIFEMRIDYDPGYRLYCALKGNELVLLLLRGDKSSQQRHREGEEGESGIRMLGTKMKIAMKWDASEYLETEADIAAYLNAALEDGDTSVITAALDDIAQAKGMTQLSKETGIARDDLYKALSPTGNPSFGTVQKAVRAFGLKLDVATSI